MRLLDQHQHALTAACHAIYNLAASESCAAAVYVQGLQGRMEPLLLLLLLLHTRHSMSTRTHSLAGLNQALLQQEELSSCRAALTLVITLVAVLVHTMPCICAHMPFRG